MKLWEELFSLNGSAVNLVPVSIDHLDGLWEAAKPEEIWTFTASKVRSKAEMERTIKKAIQERDSGSAYTFTVFDHVNRIIGSTTFLDINPAHKSVEIGSTWYHPDVWRTRVNTECKLLLLQYAFEKWGLTRVQLKTDSRNLRSQTAISRLGAVKEGTLRKDRVIADGYVRDTVFFSILNEEWENVKEQLMEKLNA